MTRAKLVEEDSAALYESELCHRKSYVWKQVERLKFVWVIRLYESEAYGGKVYELSWECARVSCVRIKATYDNKL